MESARACPSCSSVHVTRRREYRHGNLAVFFGHLLVVPSILVVLFASMGVVAVSPQATHDAVADSMRASAALASTGVPERIASQVVARRPPSDAELAALTDEQRHAVRATQMSAAESSARASMSRFASGGTLALVVVGALASTGFGVLLLRRRIVAHCASCGTIA